MAIISSPNIIQIKNAAGSVVVPLARSIKFLGGIVVVDAGDGQADVDGTGASGSPWDVLGNAGPGLVLGTTTSDAWPLIVNSVPSAGFEADGRLYVSNPETKKHILSLDTQPDSGSGFSADIGSLGLVNDSGSASLWQKTGAGDTDWTQIGVSSGSGWQLSGNNLSGASSTTPNQFLGSNNDFDVVFRRNNVETMRIISDSPLLNGLSVGYNANVGNNVAPLQLASISNGGIVQRNVLYPGSVTVVKNERLALLTTVDTATDFVSFFIANDRVELVDLKMTIRRTAGSGATNDSCFTVWRFLVRNNSGVISFISGPTQLDSDYSLIPAVSSSFSIDISPVPGSVRVNVTGLLGYTLKWSITWEGLNS